MGLSVLRARKVTQDAMGSWVRRESEATLVYQDLEEHQVTNFNSQLNMFAPCCCIFSGIPGLPGLEGFPGAPGLDGCNGTNGCDGEAGIPGPMGPRGPVGVTGLMGMPGSPGDGGINSPGVKGERGIDGIRGRPVRLIMLYFEQCNIWRVSSGQSWPAFPTKRTQGTSRRPWPFGTPWL